jgi:sec-independent protein translocase protein TatA
MTAQITALSGWEIWVVLAVALLLFGHRIPSMARSLGSGIVEFKKGLKGDDDPDAKNPQLTSRSSRDLPAGQRQDERSATDQKGDG